MTTAQIEKKKQRENLVYDAAAKIRAILDEAKKAYGAQDWDDSDKETEVLELVTGE